MDLQGIAEFAIGGIGGLIDEVVTAVTGDELLGDAAGVAANLLTGNYVGATASAFELVEDLVESPGERNLSGDTKNARALAESAQPHLAPPDYMDLQPTATEGLGGRIPRGIAPPPLNGAPKGQPAPPRGQVGQSVGATGYSATPAPLVGGGGTTHRSGGIADMLRSILNDPSLSLEEKVSMLLTEMLSGMDIELEGKMDKLQGMQSRREAVENADASDDPHKAVPAFKDGEEPSAADISRLSSELQITMQRRAQLQSLLSNLMAMSHQTSMQVINNIR